MNIITEHSTAINTGQAFYNQVMASHRNIAILLLNTLPFQKMNIADPLAGTGIRSLRFLKELNKRKIGRIAVNDHQHDFPRLFRENLRRNNIKNIKINNTKTNNSKINHLTIHNEDASLFLLHHPGFDYIDIDPFGDPNPFLAAAVARISRDGILAVTATDTAALTGTYLNSTKRKYWAQSLKNYLMHETGLRILIRKVQLQGLQFDKALLPILSYSKDHYYRAYFRCEKGKKICDKIIQQHQYLLYCSKCLNFKTSTWNRECCACSAQFLFAGPLWVGKLSDQKLVQAMAKNNPYPEEQKFLQGLAEEAKIDQVGFYDLHVLARKYKCNAPRMEMVLRKVKGVRTHFSVTGVKTRKDIRKIVKVMK